MKKRLTAFLMVCTMTVGLTACGKGKEGTDSTENTGSTYDTLVVGTQTLDGVFSPFFYTSGYDAQVGINPVFASVCRLDAEGRLIDEAGHVEMEEVIAEDGTTKYVYTISIQQDMVFSDGEPVTIDDLIFSYYVYADPTYDGMSTFGSLDIEGLRDYKNTEDTDTITGIRKIDDYTCTVTFNSANISADKQIAWLPLTPEHYYGEGFTKGNLSGVKAKNSTPLGSGAYVFEKYENNIVTLKANETYFKGCPKIPTLKFQVVNEEDKVDLVLNGEIDITDPSASLEMIAQLDESTDKASYSLVDNPGYGYIAINAERIPDVNVRKGLMCLMNREPAVQSYYGALGEVIERPMTPTLAEYPDDAEPYYTYDPAKALEYFQAAGYSQVNGKLVNAAGEQLKVVCGIGNASTHPSTPILTQMANDMTAMGAELVVNDLEFSVLSTQVQGGELDMWVMAWGNATDCDLTQIFGSQGGSNYQRYYSEELDNLQAEILKTINFEERCALVEKELDMIMDAAIYMPIYQRKNMEIYNETTLNTDTLPKQTTTYYNYTAEYETLEMR